MVSPKVVAMATSTANGTRWGGYYGGYWGRYRRTLRRYGRTLRSNSSCGDFATGVAITILISSNGDSTYYIKTKTKSLNPLYKNQDKDSSHYITSKVSSAASEVSASPLLSSLAAILSDLLNTTVANCSSKVAQQSFFWLNKFILTYL